MIAVTLEDIATVPEIQQLVGTGASWLVGEWEELHDTDAIALNRRIPSEFLQERFSYVDNRHYPEYWANRSYHSTKLAEIVPQRHFIVLNRKPRSHRRRILDCLDRLGILETNYYSWLEYRPDVVPLTESERAYAAQRPRATRVLDTVSSEEQLFVYPREQDLAAFALAIEPKEDMVFITEKTYGVIGRGQCVLPYGSAGTVQRLMNQGFRFPTEIDFAYDQVPDPLQRQSRYCEEVNRLVNRYTPEEIVEFYEPYRGSNRSVLHQLSLVRPRAFKNWCRFVHPAAIWAQACRDSIR